MTADVYWVASKYDNVSPNIERPLIIRRDPIADTWTTELLAPRWVGMNNSVIHVIDEDNAVCIASSALGLAFYKKVAGVWTPTPVHTTGSAIAHGRGAYARSLTDIVFVAARNPPGNATLYHWDGATTINLITDLGGPMWLGPVYKNLLAGFGDYAMAMGDFNARAFEHHSGPLSSGWTEIAAPWPAVATSGALTVFSPTDVWAGIEEELNRPSARRWTGGPLWADIPRYRPIGLPSTIGAFALRSGKYYTGSKRGWKFFDYDFSVGWEVIVPGEDLSYGAALSGTNVPPIDTTAVLFQVGANASTTIWERRWGIDPGWQIYDLWALGYFSRYPSTLSAVQFTPPAAGTRQTMPEGGSLMAGDVHKHIEERWRAEMRRRRR